MNAGKARHLLTDNGYHPLVNFNGAEHWAKNDHRVIIHWGDGKDTDRPVDFGLERAIYCQFHTIGDVKFVTFG